MPERILYILGAGASANALPLAKNFCDESGNIKKPGLAKELRDFELEKYFLDYRVEPWPVDLVKMKQEWVDLAENADKFGDVDTFAKYLKIVGDVKQLQQLKQSLSQYFAIKQLIEKATDKRYFLWLVSIMNKKIFPDNIKILNWNYDFQIQLAFENFSPSEDVEYSGSGFSHSGLPLQYYPNLDATYNDFHLLSMIHLNGIAGYIKQKDFYTASIFQKKHRSSNDSILEFLREHHENPQINFAWENNQYHQPLNKHINKLIEDTTIVVVIGYSFPFFNREIDKQIFEELKQIQEFKTIYYQDPVLTGQQLYSQFNLDRDQINIIHIQQTTNFHIPFEY